jgi:hypothetical protein
MQYSLSKVRVAYAIDDQWEEDVAVELDSALNRWREQVPEHRTSSFSSLPSSTSRLVCLLATDSALGPHAHGPGVLRPVGCAALYVLSIADPNSSAVHPDCAQVAADGDSIKLL